MMTADELRKNLGQFYGTERYHRLGIFPWLVGTDGVAFLAKNAECFWLIDIITSYQPKCMKDKMLRDMQFWTIKVNADRSAVVTCERDEGNVAFSQKIPYTNFPLNEVKLWVEVGDIAEDGRRMMVCMLPGER